jgi:hypothetical protein
VSAIKALAWPPGVLAAMPAEQAQLKLAWLVLSLGMLLMLALRGGLAAGHQRRWQQSALGTPVYLSGGIGPCGGLAAAAHRHARVAILD